MTAKHMEVSVYEGPHRLGEYRGCAHAAVYDSGDARSLHLLMLAGVCTISLHVAALWTIDLASGLHGSIVEAGNSGQDSSGVMVTTILDPHQPIAVNVQDEMNLAPPLTVVLPPVKRLLNDLLHTEAVEVPEESEIEHLEGIYGQQIAARIERVLEVANVHRQSPCSVRLQQSVNGSVGGVDVGDCGTNAVWQQQVVTAIRQASPLPSPPRADLFKESLTVRIEKDVKVKF
jgi:TonB C terminal